MNPDPDYYREVLLAHSRAPCGRGIPSDCPCRGLSVDSLGTETMAVGLSVEAGRIGQIGFEGEGSAVALASASLMVKYVRGRSLQEALQLSHAVRGLFSGGEPTPSLLEELGEIAALAGIRHWPARVRCATRVWLALEEALRVARCGGGSEATG